MAEGAGLQPDLPRGVHKLKKLDPIGKVFAELHSALSLLGL